MPKILVVVESPKKISYITGFLSKDYVVKASCGIFRDLDPKKMSIDFDNRFEPIYIITKPEVVRQLKESCKGIDILYIASDEDREGEAIGHSVYELLKPKHYKRLRFNEITKKAILAAIKNPGEINYNLVDAQKARRIIDRLFGYMISPLLQKKLGGTLSAGRVQSVAARIVIDRENEIAKFLEKNQNSSYFRVSGVFDNLRASLWESTDKTPQSLEETAFKGKVAHIQLSDPDPNSNVTSFLRTALKSTFKIHSISDKIAYRNPSPPFTTSTLQQEANRKFGMSLESTMKNAQALYEGGFITYMRTDSVEISEDGHKAIKKVIETTYGPEYYQRNTYKNKSSTSQEAHEAIRPVHPELQSIEDKISDPFQIKLYKLIWQRTIASQMKPAKLNITTIQITISKFISEEIKPFYYFQTQIETMLFPGFTKVYVESEDDPEVDPNLNKNFNLGKLPKAGDKVNMKEIVAKQEFLKPQTRYTQASLVKKLEELGIGRPSTYVNTIKTILDREYIKIGDIPGISKTISILSIKSENKKHIMEIFEEESEILLGREKKKLIPTELGITVNDFLIKYFADFLDYDFTANMEADLDKVAEGQKKWTQMVKLFYDKLNPIVLEVSKTKSLAQQ